MEKNMSRIQPRTLSTQELIHFCADFIQDANGLPKDWQIELLRRIKAWEGLVDDQGAELPCTDDMKVLVFGQQPGLVNLIQEQIQATVEAEGKNSGPSQSG